MGDLKLSYVPLPREFVYLLRSPVALVNEAESLFEVLRSNRSLLLLLEQAFKEFDDGRGLERTFTALGWLSFRDRVASVFIHRALHSDYSSNTNIELVEELKELEQRFSSIGVHSQSRIFLLGFYLKLQNVHRQKNQPSEFRELAPGDELRMILERSAARSERPDWILLLCWHFSHYLGAKALTRALAEGQRFDEIYESLTTEQRSQLHANLLAYGASIGEDEIFLYEKV